MSVKIRSVRSGSWEVDIHTVLPDGTRHRDRKRLLVSSKSAALRWGQERERVLLANGVPRGEREKEVPTLEHFVARFLDNYTRADRHKPSGIAAKESHLRVHLVPLFGKKKLNAITSEDVQVLKGRLSSNAPKTVNNILSTLNQVLKMAVEWGVIDALPCKSKQLPVPRRAMAFHDFFAYGRLVQAAAEIDRNTHLIVLLGGEAGLRCGEMMALEWSDVEATGYLSVARSEWRGQVTVPKGGRGRRLRLTVRLQEALRNYRHLQSPRVLCEHTGVSFTQKMVRNRVRWAERRAGLSYKGVHALRHTFCSHLVMRGAVPQQVQELAGHEELSTTQRYMHLSPEAVDSAIQLLDQPVPAWAAES